MRKHEFGLFTGFALLIAVIAVLVFQPTKPDPVTEWQNASVAADQNLSDHLNMDREHPQCGHVANPEDANTTELLCEH